MTQRERKNARQRERYANDPEYREAMLTKQREQTKTPEGRAKRLARKKRWQAANRERYLEQTRRQNARRRLRPEVRADAVRRVREWQEANPERTLDYHYQQYGLTHDEYLEMVAAQHGLCAICEKSETATHRGRVRKLAVDHDHVTGAVRALLCMRCNHSIGQMRDDPALLLKAAEYLEAYACR